MNLLFALLMMYATTVGGLWAGECAIDTTGIDQVVLATTNGRYIRPAEELLDLVAYETNLVPKEAVFIAEGFIVQGAMNESPSYRIYRDADDYYIELYVEDVVTLTHATGDIKPCAVAKVDLD